MPDRADLREVPLERQADGPVDHRPELAERARNLAQVIRPCQPPGKEAAEGERADPAHRLVAAEVDEGGAARVPVAAYLADAEISGDVLRDDLRLPDRVL